MRLNRLLRTSSFRLTVLYAAVFGGSVLILYAAVAWAAAGFMARQIDEIVANEIAEVRADAGGQDAARLREVIGQLMASSPGTSYLLQDRAGAVLAGNMAALDPATGPRTLEASRAADGRTASGLRGQGVVLSDGSYLFVGVSAFDLNEMNELLARAGVWVMALAVVLAVGGGLALSLAVLRRVEAVGQASRAIMAGDLGQRIALRGTDDEFDRLGESLNAMLDRIQELMRDLQLVSSNIAHDLRTPLTRLRQRLELARVRDGSADELRGALDAAIGHADSILETFSALLRISQIETGARRAGFATVCVSDLLEGLAEAYAPVAEERGQTLGASVEPGLHVRGDRELLTQMFANLIENAISHTPPGARLLVSAAASAGRVRASVADDGPGIPGHLRAKAVQPFYRLETSRTTPGNGLGLSLVGAVAALHDAELLLEDNAPGLRCVVWLPAGARGDAISS